MRLFDYHRPTTVAETSALMAELGDEAALLAGGTSLMNLAKLGLAEPGHVIALRDVEELHGLTSDPVLGLTLGAMTSLRAVETSGPVRSLAPGLAEAAHHVATVRIRNQATVGGNLVHADPNQDVPPMLMVYDAVARITGPDGVRTVPVADMFVGFFESVLEPDEILDSVSVPPSAPGLRSGYLKVLPRTHDDYSTIAVAAGIAVAGGGSTAVRCRAAEAALVGNGTDDATLTAAAEIVPGLLDPVTDGRGSSGYKRDMARVCTQRLLQRLVAEEAA